ncbi:MAG: TonB-dependent receptor plug domain-containing protein, partial [Proteobacteria bacterium]|nr:TonB-dependent receptor plug domain-containing protein [Pseudomonadota bacterium]
MISKTRILRGGGRTHGCALLPLAALLAALPLAVAAQQEAALQTITVTAEPTGDAPVGASEAPKATLQAGRAASSDTAGLLRNLPGVSLSGAGGVSSLPNVHGLGDDRLRIQVDGMDLISACGNHMNPPLSYIDPTRVGSVRLFAGITPVSVGGDSIGATIQVESAPPFFTLPGEAPRVSGEAGTF